MPRFKNTIPPSTKSLNKKQKSSEDSSLPQKAEDQFKKKNSVITAQLSEADIQKQLHELQVHRIELEMQIEKLKQERDKAEIASEKYFALYDFALSGYFILNREGIICELNLTGAGMLGKERSLLVNKDFKLFVSSNTKNIFSDFLKKTFQTKSKELCEVILVSGDNHSIIVHMEGKVNKDIDRCLITLIDITERKLAQDELKEKMETLHKSEERYRYNIELTGQIGWVTNAEGKIEEDIPSFRKFTGQTYEEIKGSGWAKSLHPDDIERTFKVWYKAVATKNAYEMEYRLRRYDGVYRDMIARGIPEIDDNGNIREWVGVCIDITERKKAEYELSIRNQISQISLTFPDEEMFNEVLSVILKIMNSKYGVFGYIDENGALVVPSTARHNWEDFHEPEKNIVIPRETWGDGTWQRCIKEKSPIYSNEPSTIITSAGHVNITKHISIPIIHSSEVIGLLQVANKKEDFNDKDVRILESIANYIAPILSARVLRYREEMFKRIAEENLKNTLSDLKRSNKELEQFAYVASHDLQEPLRMVSSFSQLLAKKYKDKLDIEAHEYINFAVGGANRMQDLINDLLEYSRVGTKGKQFEAIDCHSILNVVKKILQTTIENTNAQITNDNLPVVMADENQLIRLFQNLIDNAIKFHGESDPRIHISAKDMNNEWLFSVNDNGIGIEDNYKDRIFVIFQRLHSRDEYSGTGIGLAVAKRIVERHNGRIWFESDKGKGTTFYFTIPKKKQYFNNNKLKEIL